MSVIELFAEICAVSKVNFPHEHHEGRLTTLENASFAIRKAGWQWIRAFKRWGAIRNGADGALNPDSELLFMEDSPGTVEIEDTEDEILDLWRLCVMVWRVEKPV